MPRPAVSGSQPGRIPQSNVFDWVYSNPFHADSEVLRHAPSQQEKDHSVPQVPLSKPYLVDPVLGDSLNFGDAKLDALKVAASLQNTIGESTKSQSDGSTPVVLIHLPNCLQYAPLLLGVFAAGFTATMANPALTASEMERIIQLSKPQVIVTTTSGLRELNIAISGLSDGDLKRLLSNNGRLFVVDTASPYSDHSSLSEQLPDATKPWSDLLRSQPLKKAASLDETECRKRTAVILWSSGTSGKSKGVRISHSAIVSSLVAVWHINHRYDENERWLGMVPFFHIFGLTNLILLAPCCGATIYTMQKFDPQQMVNLIQKFRITYLHIAPPVALLLAKSPILDSVDMSSIKAAVSGGAPLGSEAIKLVYERLGILILMGYGLSEGGAVCTQDARSWPELQSQLGSTGQPLYGVELKIVSTENPSKILNIGDSGEVLIRSPSNMQGYLNDTAATEESLDKDGWFHTGDIGHIDEGGRLWVTDRLKEVIKVKGFQVSPADLEAALCSSNSVADAGVTSVYDDEMGTELPRAYIVPADEKVLSQCTPNSTGAVPASVQRLAAHVKSWMEEKTISYKWLRGNVVFIQQVPKSPSGKILRRLLKDTEGIEVSIYPRKSQGRASKI